MSNFWLTYRQFCPQIYFDQLATRLIMKKKTMIFISSQSPVEYSEMGFIDWLGMSSGQIVVPCSQPDISLLTPEEH